MKPFYFNIGLVLLIFTVLSHSAMGQKADKPNNKPGRKYIPEVQSNAYILPGSNTDAASGSISVGEDAIYNSYSAQQLVQNVLVTGCLTANNVRFGYYSKSGSTWELI